MEITGNENEQQDGRRRPAGGQERKGGTDFPNPLQKWTQVKFYYYVTSVLYKKEILYFQLHRPQQDIYCSRWRQTFTCREAGSLKRIVY